MVFGFLGRWNVENGRKVIRSSYEKHYQLGVRQGIEPVFIGLYGALASRYTVTRKFISEPIHMLEIAPFAMMGEATRVETLANYLLADEVPNAIDVESVGSIINDAISTAKPDDDALNMMIASMPHLTAYPIRWVDWLDEANKQTLLEAHFGQTGNDTGSKLGWSITGRYLLRTPVP